MNDKKFMTVVEMGCIDGAVVSCKVKKKLDSLT